MEKKYDIWRPWLTLDPWQEKYINTENNCFLLTGRQSGKSAAASIKFGKRAATKPNSVILMIAYTEKQAYALFFKTLMYIEAVYPKLILRKDGKRPTKHVIHLKNGSIIKCYAAGISGDGLRGETITDLVIDEAAPMDMDVFQAISPMISITGGTMDVISTPRGKEGFFYDCSLREDFTKFYVSAEDCPRHTKEFLESERSWMTELMYAQEYLAMFLDELKRVFSDEWVKNTCSLPVPETVGRFCSSSHAGRDYFLGIDIARMGKDDSAFEGLDGTDPNNVSQVSHEITKRTLITETTRKVIRLNEQWDYNKIGLDDGGMGVGVLDPLLENEDTKRKVIGLNNAKRDIDAEEGHTRLLKEDMYVNLLVMGEKNKVKLFKNDEIIASLKSIQWEFTNNKTKIHGSDSHIAEALIRALWLIKTKGLRCFITSL